MYCHGLATNESQADLLGAEHMPEVACKPSSGLIVGEETIQSYAKVHNEREVSYITCTTKVCIESRFSYRCKGVTMRAGKRLTLNG